jgi:TonB-linked SusC/RagA family outer membrane protein
MLKLNNLKLTTLVVTLLLFSISQVFAQSRTVTGTVTDPNGKGIPGVTVLVKGTTTATQTDASGTYRINAPANSVLIFSSIGYGSIEQETGLGTNTDVKLQSTEASLSEVVVIGYGTARKKDLTGAVATVNEKDFNKGTYTAPDQLIQGKVAGVQVLNNTGAPGGATTVKIRGNSAITGTGQPLYVVDGVILDGRSARPTLDAQNLGVTPGGNPLNFINPSDIASIDVLKDASATAIYGSRGAYGVIIITTKRGQSGQPKVDFFASVGVSKIMKRIDVLDANQYKQALTYYGLSNANDRGANVDALDAILQTGITQNYSLSVSGGNENGRYRLSTSYLNQEGIVNNTNFKKYTADFSANFKFLTSKRLGIDFNIIPSQYLEDIAPISNTAGSTGSLIGQALQWNPTEALILKDSKGNDSLNIKAGDVVNPLAMSEAYRDHARVTTVLGSFTPYFKITNWLEYRMLNSVTYSTGNRRSSIQQFINLADVKGKGWASIAENELTTLQTTHTLNINKKLSDAFNLNGVLGFEYMKFTNKGSSTKAYGPSSVPGGFGSYGLDYTDYIQFSNSANRTISSFVDPISELQSYFARAVANYKDRLLLTATFRADGSTKFGEDNKYGYFPSFGVGWNIDREGFFPTDFLSNLKLRASWGKTGNQEFPAGASQAKVAFNQNGALAQVNNPNPGLKWQSDKQYNIGIDFGILKGRVTGSVDYFNKKTSDLLYPTVQIDPAPPGAVVRWKNLPGIVENKGFEVTVNSTIVKNATLSWDLGVNASFIKNNVSGLDAPITTGGLHGQGVSGTLVQIIQNGLPINAFWTRHFAGLDKATGLAIYPNGDVATYEGNPNPKTLLGISTSLNVHKFSFIANLNGAFGQVIYNNTLNNVINVGSINGGRNIGVSVYEDPVKESFANPVTSSSRFIEKGDYLKLANATISYGVGNIGPNVKGLNVFITGQNLFVITKFSGFDPEVNVDKNNNGVPSVGIEYTPYPSARTITFGINFSL